MLSVDDIHYSYGKHHVLHGISFTLEKGSLTALLGANGCGKSTLLRCLLGLLPQPKDKIRIDGEDMHALGNRTRARKLAYIPQDIGAPPHLTVFDTLLLGRKPFFNSRPSRHDLEIADNTLQEFGLEDLALRSLDSLSGGQRQLAWIAKAVCQDSPVILLDEPTSNLDIRHSLEVMEILKSLASRGKTVLMVSHDILLCRKYCPNILLLHAGRIMAHAEPSAISTRQIASLFSLHEETLRELW